MRCRRAVAAWPAEIATSPGLGPTLCLPGLRGRPTGGRVQVSKGDRVEFPRSRSSGGRDDRVTTLPLVRRCAELHAWLFLSSPVCRHSVISIASFGTDPLARASGRASWFVTTTAGTSLAIRKQHRRRLAIRATEVAERRSAQCYTGRAQTRGQHHRARIVHFLLRPSHGPSRSRHPSRSCTGTSSRRDDLFTVRRRRPATIAA